MARVLAGTRTAATRTNNILYNSDFEVRPNVITAATNTSGVWINGAAVGSSATDALGWGTVSLGASAEAGFDTTTFHSGTSSMRLSTLNTAGTVIIATYKSSVLGRYLLPIAAATSYTLTGWIKTTNAVSNGVFIDFRQYSVALATLVTTSSTKFTGTNDWTKVTLTVTTNASTVWGTLVLRNGTAGNVSDAWFDDLTLTTVPVRSASGTRVLV